MKKTKSQTAQLFVSLSFKNPFLNFSIFSSYVGEVKEIDIW